VSLNLIAWIDNKEHC